MKFTTAIPYDDSLKALWNSIVDSSRNGTFLLRREYMDYHRGRFEDRSLLLADAAGRAVAALPAAIPAGSDGSVVTSHPGLTYGGLIMLPDVTGEAVLDALSLAGARYRSMGARSLMYKPVPHIYHRLAAEDDTYALWRLGAQISSVNLSAAMRIDNPAPQDTNTRRNIARGARHNLIFDLASRDLAAFHAMLCRNLAERHNAAPVHTLAELELLAARFPENIRLASAVNADTGAMEAAMLLYITDTCTHAQYICSTPEGRDHRALAALISRIMENCTTAWLDFGTSNEDGGRILNAGLFRQKNGFGARGIAYPCWHLPL